MKISIITATKNNCPTFERALLSYVSQTYPDKEYIVIDGQSRDCTLDLIAKYRSHIDVFLSETGRGIYYALNMGIRVASGEVIGFLHADDFFADNEVLTDVMDKFEHGADIVYGDVVYILPDGKVWRYWRAGKFRHYKLKFGWMPPHTTFFVRRQLYMEYGLYEQKYRISADYDMILRLLKRKELKVEYLPRILTIMSVGGKSNSSVKNVLMKMKEDAQIARKQGAWGWLTVFFKNLQKVGQLRTFRFSSKQKDAN